MDVLVSAIVLCVFVSVEGRRLSMRSRWLPIVADLPPVLSVEVQTLP